MSTGWRVDALEADGRNIAAKKFKREIDQMYEEAEGGEGDKVRAKL